MKRNLKVLETLPDGTIVVCEKGKSLRVVLGVMAGLTVLPASSAHLGIGNVSYQDALLPQWAGVLLGAGLCFFGALAVPSSEVRFHTTTREVTWTRTQWGRIRHGTADFSHILEVQMRRFGDGEGDYYRVALQTTHDVVSLLNTNDEGEAVALAQTIRHALAA